MPHSLFRLAKSPIQIGLKWYHFLASVKKNCLEMSKSLGCGQKYQVVCDYT